jgi:hypothetical protein
MLVNKIIFNKCLLVKIINEVFVNKIIFNKPFKNISLNTKIGQKPQPRLGLVMIQAMTTLIKATFITHGLPRHSHLACLFRTLLNSRNGWHTVDSSNFFSYHH